MNSPRETRVFKPFPTVFGPRETKWIPVVSALKNTPFVNLQPLTATQNEPLPCMATWLAATLSEFANKQNSVARGKRAQG